MTAGVGSAVQGTVDNTLSKTDEALRKAREKAAALLAKKQAAAGDSRATATDPKTQPPTHGTDPHAQGGVAVVDVDPSSERPLSADPTGKDSGEDVIVGRARGEKVNDAYHGHITIASLFGSELAGVDSAPGETKNGPLQSLQTSVLDPLCTSTNQQVCLSVLTANSATTATGSTNDFAVARASLLGLGVGAAESHGHDQRGRQLPDGNRHLQDGQRHGGRRRGRVGRQRRDDVEVLPRPGDADHEHLVGDRARRRPGADPGRRLRERHGRHAQRHPRRAADRLQRRRRRRRDRSP